MREVDITVHAVYFFLSETALLWYLFCKALLYKMQILIEGFYMFLLICLLTLRIYLISEPDNILDL